MEIDNNVNLALIISVIALISPLFTTFMNLIYQWWVHKMDRKERLYFQKIKPIEDIYNGYLSSVGKCLSHCTPDNLIEYGNYFPLVLMYIPKEKHAIFHELTIEISTQNDIENVGNEVEEVVKIIQTEIDKLHNSK